MPTIDGYMLAKILIKAQYNWSKSTQRKTAYQAAKAKRACPIIAVTAFTDKSVEVIAKKAGIKKVLYKPVDYDTLKAALDIYYYKTVPE